MQHRPRKQRSPPRSPIHTAVLPTPPPGRRGYGASSGSRRGIGMKRLLAGGLALVARAIRFATGADQAWHRMAAGRGLRIAPWRAPLFSAASDKRVSRSVASLATVAVVVVGWTAILPLSRAEAQTFWTGNTSNDWNTAGNWTNGVPTGNVTDIDTTTPTVLSS